LSGYEAVWLALLFTNEKWHAHDRIQYSFPVRKDKRLSRPRCVVVSSLSVLIGRWSGAEAKVVWQELMESSLCLVSCVAKCRCLVRIHWCYLIASGKSSLLVSFCFIRSMNFSFVVAYKFVLYLTSAATMYNSVTQIVLQLQMYKMSEIEFRIHVPILVIMLPTPCLHSGWVHRFLRTVKRLKPSIALNGKPWQSYGASLATLNHTVLPAIRHKWMLPALTPANQASTWFTYPGGMEGWVDLGSPIATRPGIDPTTAWSHVRHPNRYATMSSE